MLEIGLNATLQGFTEWEVLTPGGTVLQSGGFSNLITDAGLDAFEACTLGFQEFRRCLRVGTSSEAPTAQKTSLGAQVGSSTNNGGFGSEETFTITAGADHLLGSFKMVRVWDAGAAYNLTEYGLAPASSGALSITELFRDGSGAPVVVTVPSGNKLKMSHTLRIRLPFVARASTFTIDGKSISSKETFTSTRASDDGQCFRAFAPSASDIWVRRMTQANDGEPRSSITGDSISRAFTAVSYPAGSYKKGRRYVYEPPELNGTWLGVYIGGSAVFGGYKVAFQNGESFTKLDTQRLTLELVSSWGRE